MTAIAERLLEEALNLPVETRQELAARLLESSSPPEENLHRTLKTVRSRMEKVASGESKLIPAVEAHRQVRASLLTKATD
ncbi:MAG: hypothetical protein ACI8UO_001844 [Verrucomicrobiales bacterium]|jgi:hypothetical protein